MSVMKNVHAVILQELGQLNGNVTHSSARELNKKFFISFGYIRERA